MSLLNDRVQATLLTSRNILETSHLAVEYSTKSISRALDTLTRSSNAVTASRKLLDQVEEP